MVGERVIGDLLIRDDDVLRNSDDVCLLIDSDTSVEVATERVFVVGHKYVYQHHSFQAMPFVAKLSLTLH